MKRGAMDVAAEVLQEALTSPTVAPTRIIARTSTSYNFLKVLTANGLIDLKPLNKKRKTLRITEKGHEFLQHYRTCKKLFPTT
jgi:predicted transcriptional regulator